MTTIEPYDPAAMIAKLTEAFMDAEKGIPLPSKLVACVHLGLASSIFKHLLAAGLLAPSSVNAVFDQAMVVAKSPMDPNSPPPAIGYIEQDGSVTRITGKKH